MAFVASDAIEVDEEKDKPPTQGGFIAPDTDEETALNALVDDPDYDPVSDAIEAMKGEGDINAQLARYDQAKEVAFRRKQKPFSMEDARKIPGALWSGASHFVKSFGKGLGSLGANVQIAADPTESEANQERAKTEMAAAAQLSEANAAGFLNKIFGEQNKFGRIVRQIGKNALVVPRSIMAGKLPDMQAEQDKFFAGEAEREMEPRKFHSSYFHDLVDQERRRRQLTSGQVDDKGIIASGLQNIANVAGDPTMSMTESFASPQALAEMGAPPDPEAIENMATPTDLTNLVPLHVPGMGGVSRQVGGRLLNVTGKALEAPMSAAERFVAKTPVGRAAKTGGAIAAVVEGIQNPELAAKVAAGLAAAKGAQKLGGFLREAGRELYDKTFRAPEAAAAIKGEMKGWNSRLAAALDTGANKAALRRKARQVIQGGVTVPIAFAPLAYAASDSPEEFAGLVGTAGFLGMISGPSNLMGDRNQIVNQFNQSLKDRGAQVRYTANADIEAAHQRTMETADESTRDVVNAYRGFMEGLKGENGEPVQVYYLDGDGYNSALLKEGNPVVPDTGLARDANTRGFASKDGSRVYINGTKRGGSETLGHETGHVAEVLAQTAAPRLASKMRDTLKAKLYKNGKPTEQFQKFVDTYTRRLAGRDATPERLEAIKKEVDFEGEFIAETARRILAGQPISSFALPPGIRQSILDSAKDYMGEVWGLNLGPFNGEVVAQANRQTRDLLFNLGRMRQQAPEAAPAPEAPAPEAPAPETPAAAAPEGSLPKPEVTPPTAPAVPSPAAETTRAGVTQAQIDAARDYHIETPAPPAAQRANTKRGIQGKSADKIAEERGAEFDEMAESYLSALEAQGLEANPDTFYQDAIVWWLNQDPSRIPGLIDESVAAAKPPVDTAPETPIPETEAAQELLSETQPPLSNVEPTPEVSTPEETGGTGVLAPPAETAPAQPEPAALPSSAEVTTIADQAGAAAMEAPEYKRARKQESKDKIVKNAKIQALLAQIPEDATGFRQRTDEFGEQVIDGQLDFDNPIHAEIMRVAGLDPKTAGAVRILQDNYGQHIYLDYASADKPGADTGTDLDFSGQKRRAEYDESPAQERVAGTAKAYIQEGKSFIPLKTVMSKSSGAVNVLGFSLDKMLNNARFILDGMQKQGIPSGYDALSGSELDAQLQADFINYGKNQANGYKGDGSGPMKQFPDTGGPKTNLDYAPVEIPKDRFDILNMMMHNESASSKSKKAKAQAKAKEAINLARENEGFLDPQSGETNALRKQLKDAGFDMKALESPFEYLKPELIKGFRDGSGAKKTVRPSGFDVDAEAMTKKLPQGKFVAAGFMPDAEPATPKWKSIYFERTGGVKGVMRDQGHADIKASSGAVKARTQGDTLYVESTKGTMTPGQLKAVKRFAEDHGLKLQTNDRRDAMSFMPDAEGNYSRPEIDKIAEDLGIKYDGKIDWPGAELYQFTDYTKDRATNGATFTVRGPLTPEAVKAMLDSKITEFEKFGKPNLNFMPDDSGYLKAVEENNTEAAQRMVDQAAKAAGYTLETWRGESQGGEHTDFGRRREPGIFTSQNKDFAKEYTEKGKGEPRRFYVKSDKVLNLESPSLEAYKWMDQWGKDYMDGDETGWIDRQSGEQVDVIDIIASGRLFDYEGDWSSRAWKDLQRSAKADGFDVLIAPDAAGVEDATSTIILNDKNIKLADPVTYDDAGKPIPLSQRFNKEERDIRFMPDTPNKRDVVQELIDDGVIGEEAKLSRKDFEEEDDYNMAKAQTYFELGHSGDSDNWIYDAGANAIKAKKGKTHGINFGHEVANRSFKGWYDKARDVITVVFPESARKKLEGEPTVDDIPTNVFNKLRSKFGKTAEILTFMPEAEEGVKNLAPVHNLSIENLQHVLNMGGIALPSLAAVRTDKSNFDSFGDITLVAGKDLADPKGSSGTRWFNADIYSPRYPTTKIIFKDYKQTQKARDIFKPYQEEVMPFAKKEGREYPWEAHQIIGSIEDRGFRETKYRDIAQYAYLRAHGLMDKPAENATIQEISDEVYKKSKAIADEIPAWVKNQLDEAGIKYEDKIHKGYNYSGNPTYAAHTLDNVVKILKKQGVQDKEGFNYGVPSIRANVAKKYRSLEAMGKDRESVIPKEEMEPLKEETSNEFEALAGEVNNLRKSPLEGFGMMDAISDDFKAVAQGGAENWKYLRDQYGDNFSDAMNVIRPFLDKLRNMPTEYFEGKTRGAVALHEFEGAAVPDDISPELIHQLERRGLEVIKYKRGDNEARRSAVKSIAENRNVNFMPDATPEFKEWFGHSKIVDASGAPMTVYHGTKSSEDFNEFSTSGRQADDMGEYQTTGSGPDPTAYIGAHFAKEPEVANKFATGKGAEWLKSRYDGEKESPRVYPVYLSVKNPRDFGPETNLREFIYEGKITDEYLVDKMMEADGIEDPQDFDNPDVEAWIEKYESDPEFRIEQNRWLFEIFRDQDEDSGLDSAAYDLANEAKAKLIQDGHDGIIYKNEVEGGTSYAVFDPEQIKSAIGNSGDFDPNNPDITAMPDASIKSKRKLPEKPLANIPGGAVDEEEKALAGFAP